MVADHNLINLNSFEINGYRKKNEINVNEREIQSNINMYKNSTEIHVKNIMTQAKRWALLWAPVCFFFNGKNTQETKRQQYKRNHIIISNNEILRKMHDILRE